VGEGDRLGAAVGSRSEPVSVWGGAGAFFFRCCAIPTPIAAAISATTTIHPTTNRMHLLLDRSSLFPSSSLSNDSNGSDSTECLP